MAGFKTVLTKYSSQISNCNNGLNSIRFVTTIAEQKSFNAVPGPLQLPVIGSLWQFMPIIGDPSVFNHFDLIAERYYKKYGPIVKESFGNINALHLFEPEHFEIVAKATMNKPERFGFFALAHYRDINVNKYNSPGILPLNDERWWKLRQVFQKPISPLKDTRDFLGPTDKITKEFVDSLKSGEVIEDFMHVANKLNMELVCDLLFNERIHCFEGEALANDSYLSNLIIQAVELAEGIGELDRSMMFWKYFKGKSYKKMADTLILMEKFAERMMDKVKSRGNLSEDKCIAAQYMSNPQIPEKELLGIIIDLLLGGIHTTAITSCFLLYHVSRNLEVQIKLKEESRRLIPPGASITTQTLNDAVYTRAVLKETFRVNPIATGIGRNLPEDVVIGGYNIPKTTLIILQNYVACKQEHNFKDPLKFKPERWIKGSPEYETVNPYLLLPFGLGIRSCIARRRAEQNLLTLTLRMFNVGEVKWMRDSDLGFITPFMATPDAPVSIKFTKK